MTNLIENIKNTDFHHILMDWVVPYSVKIILAIIIYYIGRKVIRLISKLIRKGMDKSGSDPMLSSFVMSIFDLIGLILVIIIALAQLGVDTSSFVALIGAAGLAVGLSLKNSLQNFAAGIMILVFKPFQKGHFIEGAGVSGTVEDIGLIMLKLKTPDNKIVIVPNSTMFSGNITNYSMTGQRRVDLLIDIAYSANIKEARDVILGVLESETRLLKSPEPSIGVNALASSSVQLFVRGWVNTADYFAVKADLLERIKVTLDQNNIEIPYNTLDVNLRTDVNVKTDK
ncbi:mechanosensitive ion channel family protein [Actinobacillus delphinicola]|uniref:Small-conductance mechanosensitive channel n=1 Tax=Actinobacillus delphinicola TaxID=51161 RepID=A0A448TSG3_9PAST|nr:mechanosensitive ion channel domain-containing protein [Actinobacillus delphinicola]VEJ08751.1 Small-conductance mechanosensitive channel [Actinobacillus delphinicola]